MTQNQNLFACNNNNNKPYKRTRKISRIEDLLSERSEIESVKNDS